MSKTKHDRRKRSLTHSIPNLIEVCSIVPTIRRYLRQQSRGQQAEMCVCAQHDTAQTHKVTVTATDPGRMNAMLLASHPCTCSSSIM